MVSLPEGDRLPGRFTDIRYFIMADQVARSEFFHALVE
jgi:hypothetical protein